MIKRFKKGSGVVCAQHPPGPSGKRLPTPFSFLIFPAVFALAPMGGVPWESAAEMPAERHTSLTDQPKNPERINTFRQGGRPEQREPLKAKLEFLQQQFGESVPFQTFIKFKEIPRSLNGQDGEGMRAATMMDQFTALHELTIEGFEHIDGFSNDALRQTLASVYTETFLRNSLGGIRYLPYRWPGTAASVRDIGYVQMNIFFSPGEGEEAMTKERAFYLIEHELGHANDWNHSNVLTAGERVTMLFEITSRFKQADHYRGYHESRNVVYDRSNSQNNHYQMVREYWADLAREYVRNPEALGRQNPKDYELTEKWLRRLSGETHLLHFAQR